MSEGGWTHKQVAKWLKSKGRGKLRNYCTMCCRQFRDKDGLKNHMGSKQHLDKMREFNKNPEFYLQKFSDEFEKGFLEILVRMHGNKKAHARRVYSEYAKILHHRHLNATKWNDLPAFIEHLKESSICEVTEGAKGEYVRYIPIVDKDKKYMENPLRKKKKKKKVRVVQSLDSEQRNLEFLSKHLGEIQKDSKEQQPQKDNKETKKQEIEAFNNGKALQFSLKKNPKKRKRKEEKKQNPKKRKLEETSIIIQNNKIWLKKKIIVKCIHKTFDKGRYYKKKGKILEVNSNATATIKMIKSKDIIQMNQKDLESVIPKLGSNVLIVKGEHENKMAKLISLNVNDYNANLMLNEKKIILPYNYFSKVSK